MQDIIRAEITGNNTATACNITLQGPHANPDVVPCAVAEGLRPLAIAALLPR
jgi:hypothetical protein